MSQEIYEFKLSEAKKALSDVTIQINFEIDMYISMQGLRPQFLKDITILRARQKELSQAIEHLEFTPDLLGF
jgi:hypothetical protein